MKLFAVCYNLCIRRKNACVQDVSSWQSELAWDSPLQHTTKTLLEFTNTHMESKFNSDGRPVPFQLHVVVSEVYLLLSMTTNNSFKISLH